MPTKSESGIRETSVLYAREDVSINGDPVTPTDPVWRKFSDNVRSVEWSPDAALDVQRGLGDVDPNNFFPGPEAHTLTITYDLQRFPVDGAGDPHDASGDGVAREFDNSVTNTHTVRIMQTQDQIAQQSTVDGSSGQRDTQMMTVGRGGTIDSVTFTGDPSSQQPVVCEVTYEFETVRSYQVDQPGTATQLEVVSNDAGDTTQTLTLESNWFGSATAEDVSLNGTSPVTTTASFGSIFAADLDAQADGRITIREAGGGPDLMYIWGKTFHQGVEGDTGPPALNSGSTPPGITEDFELFLGDTITRSGGPLSLDVNSFSITVSNNVERFPREDSFAQRVLAGPRDVEASATLFGETASHEANKEALAARAGDLIWTLSGGTIQVDQSRYDDSGGRTYTAEEVAFTPDATLVGEGITLTSS